jgi:hypothetical protein
VLDVVENAAGPVPITATSTIVLRGRDLTAESLIVLLGAEEHVPAVQDVRPNAITVDLAEAGLELRAGWVPAQVRVDVPLGDPPVPHNAYPSNTVPFLLVPTITVTSTVTGTDTTGAFGHLDVTVTPAVTARQRVSLLLNEVAPPAGRPPRAVALAGPSLSPEETETTTIRFPFARVPAGDYVVRLSVDGAESPLAKDESGRYALPGVSL